MRKNQSKGGGKPAANMGTGVRPKMKKAKPVKAMKKVKGKRSSGGRY